jgi:restriction system protein
MSRSLYGIVRQAARASDRAHRRAVHDHERAVRQAERAQKASQREHLRLSRLANRAAQQAYLQSREQQAEEMNQDLGSRIQELRSILSPTSGKSHPLDFQSMKKAYVPKALAPTRGPREPLQADFNTQVEPPSLLSRMLGGRVKYEAAVEAANQQDQRAFQDAHGKWLVQIAEWQQRETSNRLKFEREETTRRAGIEDHNAAIEELERGYKAGEASAVSEYFSIILERLNLPDQFPSDFRLSFLTESRQLVVEHALPTLDVVPSAGEYFYVKTKDEIREKVRKRAQ